MNILVTGGCGYIGSVLVPMLLERGHEVTILDNFSTSSPSVLFNLEREVHMVMGDVRRKEDVEEAVKGNSAVIHLAALTGADESFKAEEQAYDINLRGTRALLEASRKADIARFIFASSCNIYGRQSGVTSEDATPSPLNPYAKSKWDAEKACLDYQRDYSLKTATLRLSTLYGFAPGMRYNLVVNMFALYGLINHPLTIYGDGSNWRPYIHARDAAKGFLMALESKSFENRTFNVGTNAENYRIEDIVRLFMEDINEGLKVNYLKEKDPGPSYRVDFSRIEGKGFENEYTMRDGIQELNDKFRYIKVK